MKRFIKHTEKIFLIIQREETIGTREYDDDLGWVDKIRVGRDYEMTVVGFWEPPVEPTEDK